MKKYLRSSMCISLVLFAIFFSSICFGAKLTDQPAATSLNNADLIHTVQDVATTPVSKKSTFTLIKSFLKTYFDGLYAVLGANADITSMTGLDDDGIPLAKVATAASDGANSDITSLAGLTTPLTVAQGGIGAATLTDGGVLIGSGTGAVTVMPVLADGEIIVGDGTTDPVAESGATALTSLGAAASGANADITSMTALTQITKTTGGAFDIAIGSAAGDDFTVDTDKFVVEGDTGEVSIGIGGFSVKKAINSATLTITASADDTDVSGVNTLFITTAAGAVVIGGFSGGVEGQVLYIVRKDATNNLTLEHAEGAGTQDLIMHEGTDETIDSWGGFVFICDGSDWYDCSHAKHV